MTIWSGFTMEWWISTRIGFAFQTKACFLFLSTTSHIEFTLPQHTAGYTTLWPELSLLKRYNSVALPNLPGFHFLFGGEVFWRRNTINTKNNGWAWVIWETWEFSRHFIKIPWRLLFRKGFTAFPPGRSFPFLVVFCFFPLFHGWMAHLFFFLLLAGTLELRTIDGSPHTRSWWYRIFTIEGFSRGGEGGHRKRLFLRAQGHTERWKAFWAFSRHEAYSELHMRYATHDNGFYGVFMGFLWIFMGSRTSRGGNGYYEEGFLR